MSEPPGLADSVGVAGPCALGEVDRGELEVLDGPAAEEDAELLAEGDSELELPPPPLQPASASSAAALMPSTPSAFARFLSVVPGVRLVSMVINVLTNDTTAIGKSLEVPKFFQIVIVSSGKHAA